MKKAIFIFILFSICGLAHASQDEPKKPVVVEGNKVEASPDKKIVKAKGKTVTTYDDIKLTADSIVLDTLKKEADLQGNVKIYQGGAVITAKRIIYNFDKKQGQIVDMKFSWKPWYGAAGNATKDSEKQYTIKSGYITTCSLEEPHYKLQARRVEIYLGDCIKARNVMLKVFDMPVMYIPYYYHPLNDNRPHVILSPGYNKSWGAFMLSAWRYYFNEYVQGRFHFDYRHMKGPGYGFTNKFNTPEFGKGLVEYYYIRENDLTLDNFLLLGQTRKNERFHGQLRYEWKPKDDLQFIMQIYKSKDAEFKHDYFPRDYDRDPAPETYVSIIRTLENFSLSLLSKKRINNWENTVEKLPEFKFTMPSYQLLKFHKGAFYYSGESSFVNYSKSPATLILNDVIRVDNFNQFDFSTKLFRFLSVNPFVNFREDFYSSNVGGSGDNWRSIFGTGIRFSTDIYKVVDYTNTEFDINKIRHVITPTISYSYINRPSISSDKFMQFDNIDALDRSNAISLGIENRLQTKRYVDEANGISTVDLVRAQITVPYSLKKDVSERFGNISASFQLRPYNWLYLQSEAIYNTAKENRRWETFNVDLSATKSDNNYKVGGDDFFANKWIIGTSYRFTADLSSNITGTIGYKINSKWYIKFYESFNFKNISDGKKSINKAQETTFVISRDLHCWIVELSLSTKGRYGNSVMVQFKLKAFPEMPAMGFSKTYSFARADNTLERN